MSRYWLRWPKLITALGALLAFQASAVPDCLLLEGIHLGPLARLRAMDGFFLGRDICLYDPALVSPERVPAFRGSRAPKDGPIMFYINGANGSPWVTSVDIAALVERSQIVVVGIFYYTTQLDAADFTPRIPSGPAVRTLKGVIDTSLARGEPLHIRADSAGTAVVSEAISHVTEDLKKYSRQPGDWLQPLDFLRVETVGALVKSFPDGPRYIHYVNKRDLIPKLGIDRPSAHPGSRAVMAVFSERELPSLTEIKQQGIAISTTAQAKMASLERVQSLTQSDEEIRQQLTAISDTTQQASSPEEEQMLSEQALLSILKSKGMDDMPPVDAQKYLYVTLRSLLKFGLPAFTAVTNPPKFLTNTAIKTLGFLAQAYRSVHRSLVYDARRRPFDEIYTVGSGSSPEVRWVDLDGLNTPPEGL
ncbi:MAG: hypothetical protein WBN85_11540 [Candidatus Macondimonas sp.]